MKTVEPIPLGAELGLYTKLTTTQNNADEVIARLQARKTPLFTEFNAELDLMVISLLKIIGFDQRSQLLAQNLSYTLKQRIGDKKPFYVNQPAHSSAFLSQLACLTNDTQAFQKQQNTLLDLKRMLAPDQNYVMNYYAYALAECGELAEAWEILLQQAANPMSSVVDYTLLYDPINSYYFSELPAYQTFVNNMKQKKPPSRLEQP
jgi:uncharacterized short protein YbdD (DUF466 family)